MVDYEIQDNTRRCAATGRELRAEEKVYTVLVDEAGKFTRQDYSAEAWQGPPANAFSFWVSRVPACDEPRRPRIDDDLLFDCFQRLDGQTDPARLNFRYIVALLLMRRKRLRFEETRIEGDREMLSLRCVRTKAVYRVDHPRLSDEELAAVQDEVFKVLGWQ